MSDNAEIGFIEREFTWESPGFSEPVVALGRVLDRSFNSPEDIKTLAAIYSLHVGASYKIVNPVTGKTDKFTRIK